MLPFFRRWAAGNHVSTVMILGSIILTAMIVHPRLLSYILLIMNAAWMFIVREVARMEGGASSVCYRCAIIAVMILVICGAVIFKINWLAV